MQQNNIAENIFMHKNTDLKYSILNKAPKSPAKSNTLNTDLF